MMKMVTGKDHDGPLARQKKWNQLLRRLSEIVTAIALITFVSGCGGEKDVPGNSSSSSSSSSASSGGLSEVELHIQESDASMCQIDGVVESQHAGFTGEGYTNSDNAIGASMIWHVNSQKEGSVAAQLTYANAGVSMRSAQISINDGATILLSFAATTEWSSWQSLGLSLNLSYGSNQIKLTAITEDGLANIDRLTLFGDVLGYGNCALAKIETENDFVFLGDEVNFRAETFNKGGEYIRAFDWDFGDGDSGSGESVAHAYNVTGDFNVSLTVTDVEGGQATVHKQVNIQSAVRPITVYIAGDSTVSNYTDTASPNDQAGWGQMLHEQFNKLVTIDNRAIGGRTARRFIDEGRLESIWNDIQAGDYLLVQFGTNDGHKTATYTLNGTEIPYYLDPSTDFKNYLQKYVDGASARGVNLVFVTPPPRNSAYCTGGNGTGAHAQGMRDLATETGSPLVDLNSKTVSYLKAICPSPSPEDFFLLRADGSVDGTHFQENGARIMSKMVAEALVEARVPLSRYRL